MAAVEQRKRRRKKFQSGKPMAVDSCQLVNLKKSCVDLERLAHKYMQKCTVDSSTESESDANVEVLNNSMFSEGSLEQTSHTKLKFLDPYDGDYEEISGTSDCSLDSLVESSHRRGYPISEALMQEDCFLPEGQEIFPASPCRVALATVIHKDELELHKICEVVQLRAECLCLSGPNPSKHGLSENSSPASALQATLDLHPPHPPSNINRKQGRSNLENAGEKQRKKLRLT